MSPKRAHALVAENKTLRANNHELRRQLRAERAEKAKLKAKLAQKDQQLRSLRGEMWRKSSERTGGLKKKKADAPDQGTQPPPKKTSDQPRQSRPKGPRPFDPKLPRKVITLPDPPPEKRICPVTGKVMENSFKETIEVLCVIPAQFVVNVYERNSFVSPAKTAPVATAWPDHVFPRHRVEASVVAAIAAEHFCEHQPYNRIEKRLARAGVHLPRATQVSLMKMLEQLVKPVEGEYKRQLLAKDYLQLDCTPLRLCDPTKRGGTVESTVWVYRSKDDSMGWYHYTGTTGGKSPDHPDRELKAAGFKGKLQVDAAAGLNQIGDAENVIPLGCFAHGRRPAFKSAADGELKATPYLDCFNRIFRIDRLAKHFKLSEQKHHQLRLRNSLPLFDLLLAMAERDRPRIPPKSHLGDCIRYIIEQEEFLRNVLITPGTELTNNAAERSLRPLKLGAKNWLHIGHPSGGPRLASLFTVVENCRQAGADVPAYLTYLITQLSGSHPHKRLAELLPAAWKHAQKHAAKRAAKKASAA